MKNNEQKPQQTMERTFLWMSKLDGYVFREFMIPFLALLFAFTLLFLIADVFNDISDFLDNKAPLSLAFQYFFWKIPGNIRFILPITVLLSTMYTLANFGRHREITAMRASGISLFRCAFPIYVVAFFVMLVNFYFNEKLVPDATQKAEGIMQGVVDPDNKKSANNKLQYHSGDRLRWWYFGFFRDDGFQDNVKLKIFAEDPTNPRNRIPQEMIEAEQTRFVPGVGWEFHNAVITGFTPEGLPGTQPTKPEANPYVIPQGTFPETPDIIVKSVVQPELLSSFQIYTLLRDNPRMAQNLKRVYKSIFWNRLAFPWVCLLCTFLALPLATKNERSGIFTAIIVAVIVVVLYQIMSEIFMIAGKSGYLPPIVAGLAPTLFFFGYSIYLIRKSG